MVLKGLVVQWKSIVVVEHFSVEKVLSWNSHQKATDCSKLRYSVRGSLSLNHYFFLGQKIVLELLKHLVIFLSFQLLANSISEWMNEGTNGRSGEWSCVDFSLELLFYAKFVFSVSGANEILGKSQVQLQISLLSLRGTDVTCQARSF